MMDSPLNTSAPGRAGVLSLIGRTPLVPIRALNPNPNVEIYAKLEKHNPGGSVKDRIALWMIEEGERSGELTRGKTILEATSGNTGIGLAMVAAVKGYPILLAMSEGVSVERRKILAALGAEFLLTPADRGTDGAIEKAYELAAEDGDRFFLADQYNNPAAALAAVFRLVRKINYLMSKGQLSRADAADVLGALRGVDHVLGILPLEARPEPLAGAWSMASGPGPAAEDRTSGGGA